MKKNKPESYKLSEEHSKKHQKAHNYVIPALALGLFVGFFALAFYRFYYTAYSFSDTLITQHVQDLKKIIERIDSTAKITSFEHDINYIDFLNVKSFVGSEVGPLNLLYPDKWEGPYLNDNPTIQEKYYQIIRSHNNYYIVPGSGVKLASNKIIGEDIILNSDADIESLLKSGVLQYNGKPLVARLNIPANKSNSVDTFQDNLEAYEDINSETTE